ncbi:MAG: hypothetical protein V4577_31200 [Bacteroidota bacterium]
MKPLRPVLTFFFFSAIVCLVASCSSSTHDNKCFPCPLAVTAPPNLTFRVVDKTTGADLFFGAAAKYDTSRLKVHHIVNGQPDTAFLHIDAANQKFNVRITANHEVDTVTMNIADKPQDILLFKRKTSSGCCSSTYLSSVTFNGVIVYQQGTNPDVVAVLEK